ncbi:MAG: transglutaminase family protein [Salinivirgaceae bacterium]|nr:transglutaminase family protein [Salinivirgaceae bacterium]
MLLKYAYRTLLTFSQPVSSHTFMLRCVPYSCPFQRIINESTTVIPNCQIGKSTDSFGSVVQTGYVADFHDAFMFESKGIVDVGRHETHEELDPIFRHPSALTMPSDKICNTIAGISTSASDTKAWIAEMSNQLAQTFAYRSGTTNVATTAAEAFGLGEGVCQDYAHIAIAMCRKAGIAARYVNGFMIGEGATHAWIEYFDNGTWRAFDPTNNRCVDDSYIKIAHGRDFNDCSINRGHFNGIVQQTVKVSLLVEQIRRLPHYIKD